MPYNMIRSLHALMVILATITLILVSLALWLVVIAMILDGSIISDKGIIATLFSVNIGLMTFAHLNMWQLHARVEKISPQTARYATNGIPYASYIDFKSSHINLHKWVRKINQGYYGDFPSSIMNHANFTLKTNTLFAKCVVITMIIPSFILIGWAIIQKI